MTIHRVIDLMTAYHASPLSCWSLKIEIDRQELGQFIDLLHAFPGRRLDVNVFLIFVVSFFFDLYLYSNLLILVDIVIIPQK